MIVLKSIENRIIEVEPSGSEIPFALCDQPDTAIALMYRGWKLNADRRYTAAARLFFQVEQLPGFAWVNPVDGGAR